MSHPGPTPSYLFLDTETSDLPDYGKAADEAEQPRLVEFAMTLTDFTLMRQREYHAYIKPDGWEITPRAFEVNGLTLDFLNKHGVPVAEVLEQYAAALDEGRVVVAYNARFDLKIMRGEMRRAGMDDRFEKTFNSCAMVACRGRGIVKANGKGGQPALFDACNHFGMEVARTEFGRHTASGDLAALVSLVGRIRPLGWMPEPAVHYAKNRPGQPDSA